MRNTDHLTDEELKKLWAEPLSEEAAETMRKADEADRPLIAISLRELISREKPSTETGDKT